MRFINDAASRTPEIVAFIDGQRTAGKWDYREILRAATDRFPAIYLVDMWQGEIVAEGLKKDPVAIKRELQEASTYFSTTVKCIGLLKNRASTVPRECNQVLRCAPSVGFDDAGLFRYKVATDYSLSKVRITTGAEGVFRMDGAGTSPSFLKLQKTLETLNLDQCRYLSLLTDPFEPRQVLVEWKHPIETMQPSAAMKEYCSRPEGDYPEAATIKALLERFPYSDDLKALQTAKSKKCGFDVIFFCGHMRRQEGGLSYTYRVGDCGMRTSSLAQLQTDLSGAKTPDERQSIQDGLNYVEACEAAARGGYTWEYQDPFLSSACGAPPKKTESERLASALAPSTPPPAPPPSPKKKDLPAKFLDGRTSKSSWSKSGWNVFRWGMGPADVQQLFKDKGGEFQAFGQPDCEVSDVLSAGLVGCLFFSEQHTFRLAERNTRILFNYLDGQLYDVTLYPSGAKDGAEAYRDFKQFAELLRQTFGNPSAENIPPWPNKELWLGSVDWKTPTLNVSLLLAVSPNRPRPMFWISYQDPTRLKIFEGRAAKESKQPKPKKTAPKKQPVESPF